MRYLYVFLICVAAAAMLMSVQVIARSLRTASLNRQLARMHTVDGQPPMAEIAAPAMTASYGTGRGQRPVIRAGDLKLTWMSTDVDSPIPPAAVSTQAFHKASGDVLPDMLKLLRANPDTVGWISIDDIVHLPVMYRENSYYLNHDFKGHRNTSGALFLDQGSPLTAQTQNLLIHGHSMFDGSMFGLLTHYQKLETLLRHPLVSFSTLYEKEAYAIFAVLNVTPGAFDYSTHPFFPSDVAFEAYIASVRQRSLYDIPVDVKPADALLTLSTCIDDDRLVILARKLRQDETRDELVCTVEQSTTRTHRDGLLVFYTSAQRPGLGTFTK
jgi:sortase B